LHHFYNRSNQDATGLYLETTDGRIVNITVYVMGGLHTLTKTYTIYSHYALGGFPYLDNWWFFKEVKDEPDGLYYDKRNHFIEIKTKGSIL